MADFEQLHATRPSPERLKRRAFAIRAHQIEGNPLDLADIELLERFDREGLSDEQRIAFLTTEAHKLAPK